VFLGLGLRFPFFFIPCQTEMGWGVHARCGHFLYYGLQFVSNTFEKDEE